MDSESLGKEIDPELVYQFEKEMGFKLPERYIAFIIKFDNGSQYENGFEFINYYGEKDDRDICFKSFDAKSLECIYYCQINDSPDASPYFVQFGTSGNGDHICFDYTKDPTSSEPAVVVVFHDDVYTDETGQQKMVVNHVANSFGEFVDLLCDYVYDDDELENMLNNSIEIEV